MNIQFSDLQGNIIAEVSADFVPPIGAHIQIFDHDDETDKPFKGMFRVDDAEYRVINGVGMTAHLTVSESY